MDDDRDDTNILLNQPEMMEVLKFDNWFLAYSEPPLPIDSQLPMLHVDSQPTVPPFAVLSCRDFRIRENTTCYIILDKPIDLRAGDVITLRPTDDAQPIIDLKFKANNSARQIQVLSLPKIHFAKSGTILRGKKEPLAIKFDLFVGDKRIITSTNELKVWFTAFSDERKKIQDNTNEESRNNVIKDLKQWNPDLKGDDFDKIIKELQRHPGCKTLDMIGDKPKIRIRTKKGGQTSPSPFSEESIDLDNNYINNNNGQDPITVDVPRSSEDPTSPQEYQNYALNEQDHSAEQSYGAQNHLEYPTGKRKREDRASSQTNSAEQTGEMSVDPDETTNPNGKTPISLNTEETDLTGDTEVQYFLAPAYGDFNPPYIPAVSSTLTFHAEVKVVNPSSTNEIPFKYTFDNPEKYVRKLATGVDQDADCAFVEIWGQHVLKEKLQEFVHQYATSKQDNTTSMDTSQNTDDTVAIPEYNSLRIHWAALIPSLRFIQYWVEEREIDMNIQDIYGITPLHLAVWANNHQVVVYLICKGANPDLEDNYGNTPLSLAQGDTQLMKLLTKASVQETTKQLVDLSISSPISAPASSLTSGAQLNSNAPSQETLEATMEGLTLQSLNASSVFSQEELEDMESYQTPITLNLRTDQKQEDFFHYMEKHEVYAEEHGASLLHVTSFTEQIDQIQNMPKQYLKNYINAVDKYGNTPLDIAMSENPKLLELLSPPKIIAQRVLIDNDIKLPPEIWGMIYDRSDLQSLLTLSTTCNGFYSQLSNESIWQYAIHMEYQVPYHTLRMILQPPTYPTWPKPRVPPKKMAILLKMLEKKIEFSETDFTKRTTVLFLVIDKLGDIFEKYTFRYSDRYVTRVITRLMTDVVTRYPSMCIPVSNQAFKYFVSKDISIIMPARFIINSMLWITQKNIESDHNLRELLNAFNGGISIAMLNAFFLEIEEMEVWKRCILLAATTVNEARQGSFINARVAWFNLLKILDKENDFKARYEFAESILWHVSHSTYPELLKVCPPSKQTEIKTFLKKPYVDRNANTIVMQHASLSTNNYKEAPDAKICREYRRIHKMEVHATMQKKPVGSAYFTDGQYIIKTQGAVESSDYEVIDFRYYFDSSSEKRNNVDEVTYLIDKTISEAIFINFDQAKHHYEELKNKFLNSFSYADATDNWKHDVDMFYEYMISAAPTMAEKRFFENEKLDLTVL